MLWQKVSNHESSCYVDICLERTDLGAVHRLHEWAKSTGWTEPTAKNNDISTKYRNEGNEAFRNEQFVFAVEMYNRSLCFAEVGTENVSLAYANRSACFFKLKWYDKCLADIELAKKTNYPDRLMPKLTQREADCLKFIAAGQQAVPFVPQLSFPADEKFPGMANVLQIERNDEFGRHVIAKSDIAVGQTILIEEAFISAHHQEKYSRCGACLKVFGNLDACPKCTIAMFCQGKCEANDFHKIECEMKTIRFENDGDQQLNIIRTVLMAINLFPTVDELHAFVKDAISSDPMEIPESLSDDKSKYRAFLKLKYSSQAPKKPKFSSEVNFVFKLLLENAAVGPKFTTKVQKRFLMHLIAHHMCVYAFNSGGLMFDGLGVGWNISELLSIVSSYVQHSCAPNVTVVLFNGFKVLVALRRIKKGEQVFVSYFRNNEEKLSAANRRKYLLENGDFDCKCNRCKGMALPRSDRDAMKNDACFKYIQSNEHIVAELDKDSEPVKKLSVACVSFLTQHGDKEWSNEIELTSQCYRRYLAVKHGMVHLCF